jgi:hypothetical protein
MFLSKYSLDINNNIALLFRTQYTSDFLIAEYCGLRNTIFWVTEDFASEWQFHFTLSGESETLGLLDSLQIHSISKPFFYTIKCEDLSISVARAS